MKVAGRQGLQACECAVEKTSSGATGTRVRALPREGAAWHEIHTLIDGLTEDEALRPGYFPEGWTAKDCLAHLGTWLAEAGMLLEQIAAGTYVEGELDVDAANRRFLESMRDVPLHLVRSQAMSSRSRLLGAFAVLPVLTPAAEWWVRKAGPEHYGEHLPRLREWCGELVAGRFASRQERGEASDT